MHLPLVTGVRPLSSWELDTGCRVLMAGVTGSSGHPEADHVITKWDNIARCHLFADQ